MSSYLGVRMRVSGYIPEREDDICDAARETFNFNGDWEIESGDEGNMLIGYGEDNVSGYDSALVDDLSKAVWEANGGPCEIEFTISYLDNPPTVDYSRGEEDYQRLMQSSGRDDVD
jgi:hypothetical protein